MLNILNNKEKMRELIVYGIFGVLTTIVSFGSFALLRYIFTNINESLLNIISLILAIIFAYVTNRKYVFKSKEKNILNEMIKFFSSRAFSAVFEIIAFFILNEILKIEGLIAKAIVSIFVIILNYILSKLFVFRSKNKQEKII